MALLYARPLASLSTYGHSAASSASLSSRGLCAHASAARMRRSSKLLSTQHAASGRHLTAVQCVSKRNQQALDALEAFTEAHVKEADVIIECRPQGKEEFDVFAHSAVLRLASAAWKQRIDEAHPNAVEPAYERVTYSAELVDMLLCCIYPIYPRPEVTWENVEDLCSLAHDWEVDCVLHACKAFLEDNLFPASDEAESCDDSRDSDLTDKAAQWLALGEYWGLDGIADMCTQRLLKVHKAKQLQDVSCLDKLSATDLRKLVQVMLVREME